MIPRIILGVMAGVIGESFVHDRFTYGLIIISTLSVVFMIDSITYGSIYCLMAMCELCVGYKLSNWLRGIRERYGY